MHHFSNCVQKPYARRVLLLTCIFFVASALSWAALPTAAQIVAARPTKQTSVTAVNLFDPSFKGLTMEKKLSALRKLLPDGKYWNSIGSNVTGLPQNYSSSITSNTPCSHSEVGVDLCNVYNGATAALFDYGDNMQCLGFASLVSDFLFGKDAPVTLLDDFSDLQVGDHIRYVDYEHSMIVTAVAKNSVTVVECNMNYEDCLISWDIEITREDVESYYNVFYISRQNGG